MIFNWHNFKTKIFLSTNSLKMSFFFFFDNWNFVLYASSSLMRINEISQLRADNDEADALSSFLFHACATNAVWYSMLCIFPLSLWELLCEREKERKMRENLYMCVRERKWKMRNYEIEHMALKRDKAWSLQGCFLNMHVMM